MKPLINIMLPIVLTLTQPAKADMFGGDVVVLAKILVQSIQQLTQLRRILRSTRDELNLIKDINRGINESLGILKTIDPNLDPGIFKELRNLNVALSEIERVYGKVKVERHLKRFKSTDQSVAEAMVFNNQAYRHAGEVDQVAEEIKQHALSTSPGGAQKLTAESMGVLLKVENSQLRAQAKSIKLQAQNMARQNRIDKERAFQIEQSVNEISEALEKQNQKPKFTIPRF